MMTDNDFRLVRISSTRFSMRWWMCYMARLGDRRDHGVEWVVLVTCTVQYNIEERCTE